MVFPDAGPLPRHPSQLYEFTLEGVVLFLVLWIYARQPRPQAFTNSRMPCTRARARSLKP